MFRDHVHFGNDNAVAISGGTSTAWSLPDEGYVMAQMWLEIHSAGSDLEYVASVIFCNCVVTIAALQTTLNISLVCIGARRGNLCKPQHDQQGRYNDQQKCSLHGSLRRFLTYA
jgi:hypothetical protein